MNPFVADMLGVNQFFSSMTPGEMICFVVLCCVATIVGIFINID